MRHPGGIVWGCVMVKWCASGFLRYPASVKGTATEGHRDGRVVEEGRDVAAGAAEPGEAQTGGDEALAGRRILGISVTEDERAHRPALGLA